MASPNPFVDPSDVSRSSKYSVDSSPSTRDSTGPRALLADRPLASYPTISYRFAAAAHSSPSLSAASDSPYLGPSRPLSLGQDVRILFT